jgi:pyruvate kinase
MDIPGIKPRTANSKDIQISQGQKVYFGPPKEEIDTLQIELTKSLPSYDKSLNSFSLNDGQFLFEVEDTGSDYIVGRSRDSFTLLPKKGINLPNSVYDDTKQFEIYKDFINEVSNLQIDALGLSFIQNGEVVDKLRSIRPDLILISKIENSEGLRNCSEIAARSDAVMIDRGDLVAEVGYHRLFSGIEEIALQAKLHGKPLIMATENLESMIDRELPSKSEVVSLAHSASIGVDCFMLSEETAMSSNAHVIVRWLNEFLEKSYNQKINDKDAVPLKGQELDIWQSVSQYKELPTLIMSKSGRAVARYLSNSPDSRLFVITNSEKLKKMAFLYRNHITILMRNMDASANIELIHETVKENVDLLFSESDKILVIYVSKYANKPRANTLTLLHKNDFT